MVRAGRAGVAVCVHAVYQSAFEYAVCCVLCVIDLWTATHDIYYAAVFHMPITCVKLMSYDCKWKLANPS